jgi:hypothetical protein
MNAHQHITPALVSEKAVQRLPRWALWLLCGAYVLPGLIGRDPWKNADIAAFGQMWSLALGQSSWWAPNVGGVPPSGGGILPYWLGALSIQGLTPWLDPALAARLPFVLLLAAVLALTWYTTFHLARTDAAKPLPFAFGGEAPVADYARALADGSVLALIASLGLLQLGHETTPELLQLTGSALLLYGLAAAAYRPWKARLSTLISLTILAGSGSPSVAMLLSLVGGLVCFFSNDAVMKRHLWWVLGAGALAAAVSTALTLSGLSGWHSRLGMPSAGPLLRLFIWFPWPTLPLAALTVWSWRRQALRRHIAVPLFSALVGMVACVAMGGIDRALLHSLPPLAVLAAFALPVIKRGLGSAIDWFSVFFFSGASILIWVGYSAMHLGWPERTAVQLGKLVPGYTPAYSLLALILASTATVLWIVLVRWRTARHQHALWKSLVLPAGGVALGWLLLMTLWLPLLDQARSYRLLMDRLDRQVSHGRCVLAPGATVGLLTALEYFGGHRVHGTKGIEHDAPKGCNTLVLSIPARQVPPQVKGWRLVGRERQRTQNSESIAVYARAR